MEKPLECSNSYTNTNKESPNSSMLGELSKYVSISLTESQERHTLLGELSGLLSEEQKNELMSLNYDELDKWQSHPLLKLIRMGIRTGIIKKPSKVLRNTNCSHFKGKFSDGKGSA